MNLMKIKGSKKERKYSNEGILESLESIVKETANQAKASVDGGTHDAWNQILQSNSSEKHHESAHGSHETELKAGEEFDLSGVHEKAAEITEMGRQMIAEVVHAGERAESRNSQEMEVRMQEILIEIRKLSESSGELQKQVEVIAMEQTAGEVGIYHVNFLEKMFSYIQDLRMSVEDSLAWFGALRSKKAARQYHSMAKKHGTSFTLGNERQVATSVG